MDKKVTFTEFSSQMSIYWLAPAKRQRKKYVFNKTTR